jgi:hypothetical protein
MATLTRVTCMVRNLYLEKNEVRYRSSIPKFDTVWEKGNWIYHGSIWHLTGCSRIGQEGLERRALEGRESRKSYGSLDYGLV